MHCHLLVVRHRRRCPELPPYRYYIINDDPGVISSCEDAVNVLCANVCDVMEGCPRLLVVQAATLQFKQL